MCIDDCCHPFLHSATDDHGIRIDIRKLTRWKSQKGAGQARGERGADVDGSGG
jgi:hypothetical protein